LQIQTEENIYLKEKNGYGILAGIEKEFAKEKYPELVESMSEGYIFGAEPEDQFIKRVKYIHNKFLEKNQNIIVVTHGGFINRLLENVLNKKYIKAGDCGYFIFDTYKNEIEFADGIEFENK
jgi:broad specificity phosphatase PhoE